MSSAVTIENIIEQAKLYNPSSNSELLRAAYNCALTAHDGQLRDSGEPYIIHPLSVASILCQLQMDDVAIMAGLLHDVIEDTTCTPEELAERFGEDTLRLVEGVTKLSKLRFVSRQEAQAENLRKMFLAMSKDIRIVLVKLADRLHNMRTIGTHRSPKRRLEIAEETLTIFAPLAHRLGVSRLKSELEDLSIAVLEADAVEDIKRQLADDAPERDRFINQHCQMIIEDLAKAGIKAEVNGRVKNFYSIYNKMRRQNKALSEIFDLYAIRVIVDDLTDCYSALGIIHTRWKPLPGRFKDYIAMPKQNAYQSLHTTLIAEDGVPFEVQIRTWEMHRTAEYGIAAHWRYKEGRSAVENFDEKVEWLRQMLEWQQDVKDSQEFMEEVKGDLFAENIYVFTPRGDVYELPSGSGPLDFAYRVHTDVGHQCVGARVNRRLVPLTSQLKNGDIVEILTQKGRGPSRDWLNVVHTPQAKNKIRQWFRKEKRDENIQLGRDAFAAECRKFNLDPQQLIKMDEFAEATRRYGFKDVEDIMAGLGAGQLRAELLVGRLRDALRRNEGTEEETIKLAPERHTTSPDGIWVEGADDVMVRVASCCKPLPGDAIVGYVTRGRGVSVHRADCPNARRYQQVEPDRLITVGWAGGQSGVFQAELEAFAFDRDHLAMDVMSVLAESKTPLNGINIFADKKKNTATIQVKVEVTSLDQLDLIMARLRRVKDVYDVHRTRTGSNNGGKR